MQIVERWTSILSSPEENSRLKFSSPSGGEENSRFKFSSPPKLGCTWSWVGEVLPLFRRTSVCTRKLVSCLVSMCLCRSRAAGEVACLPDRRRTEEVLEEHKGRVTRSPAATDSTSLEIQGIRWLKDSACCSRYQRTSASKWETTSQGTKRVATTRIRPFSFQVLAWPGSCQCPYPVPLCFSYAFQHWKTVLSVSCLLCRIRVP